MSAAITNPMLTVDRRGLESLLSFWADAGVDTLYAAEPVDRTRLARPETRVEAPLTAAAPVAAAPIHDAETPRRLAEGSADLDRLRQAADAYLRDSLGVAAPVLWRGAADAAVVVIGEAPDVDDEIAGSPFSGAVGRLLARMLAAAGLSDRVLIAHTVFWRPPGDRPPTPEEQAVCAPFLERAIALAAPRALLLTGAGAARATLRRSDSILSLQGRWLEWRSVNGALEIPALPTLGLDLLLRQPTAKPKSWNDLLTLGERIDRPHRPD